MRWFATGPVLLLIASLGLLGTGGCCDPNDPDCDGGGSNGGGSTLNVEGDWFFQRISGEEVHEWVLKLSQDGSRITGTAGPGAQRSASLGFFVTRDLEPTQVTGSVSGSQVTLTFDFNSDGSTTTFNGTYEASQNAVDGGRWTAWRWPPPDGVCRVFQC